MEPGRLNPVTLIVGAVSRFGAEAARALAARSQGGLLLGDENEAALLTLADELEAERSTPERLSTLAFSVADAARWAKASSFIAEQYGRLDYAIVNAPQAPPPELVDFRPADRIDFNALALSLRAVTALMRRNVQGGGVVIGAAAQTLQAESERDQISELLEIAAASGRDSAVRVNVVVVGGAGLAPWRSAAALPDLETSSSAAVRDALEALPEVEKRMLRCPARTPLGRVIALLLSDDLAVSGAQVAVDAEQTM